MTASSSDSDKHLAWAKLVVEIDQNETTLTKLEKDLADLPKNDPGTDKLEAKIKNLKDRIEVQVAEKEIEVQALYSRNLNVVNEEQEHVKLEQAKFAADIFTGNIVNMSCLEKRGPEYDKKSFMNLMSRGIKLQKPPTFNQGDNFIRFCKRFREHALLSGAHGLGIDRYFLSYINCESTWDKLQKLKFTVIEQNDIDELIKRCTDELFPPAHAWTTRAQLLTMKQSETETIEEFCSKLEELACKSGYESDIEKDKCCLQTLVMGAREQAVKIKLLESGCTKYDEAVKLAVNTERILAMAGDHTDPVLTVNPRANNDEDVRPVAQRSSSDNTEKGPRDSLESPVN